MKEENLSKAAPIMHDALVKGVKMETHTIETGKWTKDDSYSRVVTFTGNEVASFQDPEYHFITYTLFECEGGWRVLIDFHPDGFDVRVRGMARLGKIFTVAELEKTFPASVVNKALGPLNLDSVTKVDVGRVRRFRENMELIKSVSKDKE